MGRPPPTRPGDATDDRPRPVKRREMRGVDPETSREIRNRENRERRAGMRNFHLAVNEMDKLCDAMGRVNFALLRCRERRDVRGLTGPLGENPKRPPLDESIIALARQDVAQAVGLRREEAEAHHPKPRWKFGLVGQTLAEARGGPGHGRR